MAITVGRVIDLNFEPFYIDMVRRGIVLHDVSLKDVPQSMRDGEINAGPVSLVDSFALEDINTYHLEALVVGVEDNGGERASYRIATTVYRTAAGGATFQVAQVPAAVNVSILHSAESDAPRAASRHSYGPG